MNEDYKLAQNALCKKIPALLKVLGTVAMAGVLATQLFGCFYIVPGPRYYYDPPRRGYYIERNIYIDRPVWHRGRPHHFHHHR